GKTRNHAATSSRIKLSTHHQKHTSPGGHSLFPWNANHFSSPVFGLSQGGIPRPGHRNRPPQQPLTPATLERHGKIEFVKTNPENPTTRWYFRKPPPGPKLISSFRPAPRWHKTIYTPTEHRRTPPPTKQQNTRSTTQFQLE